jgi:ABC-2 type transport system permease protein
MEMETKEKEENGVPETAPVSQAKGKPATALPSDIQQVITVTRFEILRYLRGWRLPGLIILTLLVAVLIGAVPIALKSNISKEPLAYASQYTSFVSILVVLSVTFFGADSLVGEFQNRTAYSIFPNPVKRDVIFAGKFMASVLCAFVVIGFYYAIIAGATMGSTGGVPSQLGQSFLLCLLYAVAGMALAFLISSFMRGTTGANIFVFFLFFMIFNIVDSVLSLGGVKPWGSLTFAGGTIDNIMTSPYPVDTVSSLPGGRGGMSFHQYYSPVAEGAVAMLGYFIACIILSMLIFRKRDVAN